MTDWRERLSVPRDQFVPSVVWVAAPATDGFVSVSREEDESRWRALIDADEPIVTQVDDGETPPGGLGLQPSSSCSQPSLVATMLDALEVHEGHRVLEIGTGTGWNAALLSERAGEAGHVVSIEVDPDVADNARDALVRVGHAPLVVTADGTGGHPRDAPYDRVICTASVRRIPRPWIDQTRPGGLIVTPWGTDYGYDALLRLDVHEDGSASGRCGMSLAFMRVRHQRRQFLDPTAEEQAEADATTTARSGQEFFEITAFPRAAFTIGLRVPYCYVTVEDLDVDHRRIEFHDARTASWARVAMVRGADSFEVRQLGPRRLWDEVDDAYAWWRDHGKPTPDRYGLTVHPDGEHTVWIDTSAGEHRWSL
ncbi:protein-L-isoaspartate(D-aspartate) O-methyltransferase [Herbihabitans rhizosphaerae]|uniref:Protein-L-isoaspartate O-methyltransferase n=1 Tax=Herbihabitans rhizosphaerae TaxID=1872711 RepID=A0A4V2ESK6_9PSEU|nr:methyltransferase domain-containing protein [Herbihabitans rhizosphaerae]RZS37903.1 protein-L-isoaspartate(D-aspartate) O-methyltransferase [Herbihabitans rhizosphaerae]